MVLMINTTYFPPGKAAEVGKKYIEALKKLPPDRSISKTLVTGASSTTLGIKVSGISEVKKGKVAEAYARTSEFDLMFADVEGFRYEIETVMDITEAMPVVGLQAPEDR